MKIMIASDIHGSELYCAQTLKAFEAEGAQRLLLLGDILYHGPRNELPKGYNPKGAAEKLNAVKDKLLCVQGNCDSQVDQMVLDFPLRAEYCILYTGQRMIFATHGHLFNPDNPPPLQKGDILLCGHTHIPECREENGYLYVNPGSVSIPKGESYNGYMILTDRLLEWKDFSGNTRRKYSIEEM